jgi:hypothetical protein
MAESTQIDLKPAAGHADAAFDFDPWTATTEQALKFARLAKPGSQEPLAQRAAAQEVQALHLACLAHDGGCKVLHCLKLCLVNELMPPSWLRDAFIHRYNQVPNADVKTWDEAFGAYWRPRTRLAKEKEKIYLKEAIYNAAWNLALSQPTLPIRRDFFDILCETHDFDMGASTVEGYYYECLREGRPNVLSLRSTP